MHDVETGDGKCFTTQELVAARPVLMTRDPSTIEIATVYSSNAAKDERAQQLADLKSALGPSGGHFPWLW